MASLELEARLENLLNTAQKETKDIDLFGSIPEKEECPICLIPLPINKDEICFMLCCAKFICQGCSYKEVLTGINNGLSEHALLNEQKCALCRQVMKGKNIMKQRKKLIKKNNANAYIQMACLYRDGEEGLIQSYTRSLEMSIKAAELDHVEAFVMIGWYYEEGIVVEEDTSKALEYYEVAAKKGSVLGHLELSRFYEEMGPMGDMQRVDHLKVVAKAGDQESMDNLMKAYKDNLLSKEELTQTLREFQISNDKMKSKDRDDVRAFMARISDLPDPPDDFGL